MEVNKKLKEYLDSHGITQAFLVKKTGISQEKISNIINSRRKVTADELGRIANALEVSANIFLG
ncbi:MAG: helix-turn-helix domain-containing protein [Anaeroplasma sp.]